MSKEPRGRAFLVLLLIVLTGGWWRFSGIDWDEGFHLHPDERYISLVLSAISTPPSFAAYLSPERNTLSPYLTQYSSYIYGQLPLTVIKYLSVWLGMDSYGEAYLLGRLISVLLDTASIIMVFLLGKRLINGKVGLFAALIYAMLPLAIQYAHFMVMESWLSFFWLLTLNALLWWKSSSKNGWRMVALGISLGASGAVKATSVFLAALVGLSGAFASLPLALASFRLLQPTIFSSASWFDWSLHPQFETAFAFQQRAVNGAVMFPPQWQWVGTPAIWFLVKNYFFWGVGPALSLLVIVGIVRYSFEEIRKRRYYSLLLVGFLLAMLVYHGIQFVKTIRYLLPLLGMLSVFGGIGACWMNERFHHAGKMAVISLLFLSALWATAFTSIYRRPQTRVQASRWIFEHIPAGSAIAIEEWDDPLPLPIAGISAGNYRTFQMNVYAPDDGEKERKVSEWLAQTDWIILSTRRAKGSIGRLPTQFPIMTAFYRGLESGTLGFVKAAEFSSFPSLTLGRWSLMIDDSAAEESFWVFDHPTVEIYQKL